MSKYIRKSYNVAVLIYHLLFSAKYRRVVSLKTMLMRYWSKFV